MEVDLQGVAMIAGGPLAVHAVGKHLAVKFRKQNRQTPLAPPPRVPYFGKQRAHIEQTERFAGQVRVGAVVRRVEALHVAGVMPDLPQKLREERAAPHLRPLCEVPDPAPRDHSDRHF